MFPCSYEKRYLDTVNLKSTEQFPDDRVKESAKVEITSKAEDKEDKNHSKTSTSSTTEQDLDAFLLGDSDDDPSNLQLFFIFFLLWSTFSSPMTITPLIK